MAKQEKHLSLQMSRIYEKYDKIGNFNWYEERLAHAKKMGYNYVSESIIQTYLKTKSARKTGKLCCNLSHGTVYDFLHKIGFPVNKRGYHNPKKKFPYNGRMLTYETISFLSGYPRWKVARKINKQRYTAQEVIDEANRKNVK